MYEFYETHEGWLSLLVWLWLFFSQNRTIFFFITLLFLCRWKSSPNHRFFQILTVGCCSLIPLLLSVALFDTILFVNSRLHWNCAVPAECDENWNQQKRKRQNIQLRLKDGTF